LYIRETSLPGVLLIEPKVFGDTRGFFMETYRIDTFREAGIADPFVQDNHSRSARGVLRGLHYQEPNPQGKLVRCTRGAIFDVAVDIRRGSLSFGHWFGVELSQANKLMLWIPPGFAHGFCAVEDESDLVYKCTTLYDPKSDRAILWNDPEIGIEWPIATPLLSPKDAMAPLARDAMAPSFIERPIAKPLLSQRDAEAPSLKEADLLPNYSRADAQRDEQAAASARDAAASVALVIEDKRQKKDFDVFLCHNSVDIAAVKDIGRKLMDRGILPWLAEWEIQPFVRWQDELEKIIPSIKSVAVFVGPSSAHSPWQDMEIKAFLQEFIQRHITLGLVLLPGATQTANLPVFLKSFNWVDFNKKDPDPLAQLVWAVTGQRPAPYDG
jgi:dTDP-4-dehydrorhamnose 3,5-epimerase